MDCVHLVVGLILLQYIVTIFRVGQARGRYGVAAPATTGHEIFERWYRVQSNSLELLVVFVPAVYAAAHYYAPLWPTAAGASFLVGRILYQRSYVSDPKSRGLGFVLSMLPTALLVLASVIGAARALLSGAAG